VTDLQELHKVRTFLTGQWLKGDMNFFPKNEHAIERVIRVVGGAGILSLAFVGPQSPWAYLGIIPMATGLMGSCPMYTLFGFSTCPVKNAPSA
jgi:hypothetical protein